MKLYLRKRSDDFTPLRLYHTRKAADADLTGGDEVEEITVENNAKAVCNFINDRFGTAIFEN